MQPKQVLNLLKIRLQQTSPLPLKLVLNTGKLRSIIRAHVDELELHSADQLIDVVVLAVDELHVGLVFGGDGVLELLDEFVFVFDDFLASCYLHFNILGQLFAVFFLLEFLPVPVDLNVLFVGDEHLVLQLGSPLNTLLLFKTTPNVFLMIGLEPDFVNHLVSLTTHLLENAIRLIDLFVSITIDLLTFYYFLSVLLEFHFLFITAI